MNYVVSRCCRLVERNVLHGVYLLVLKCTDLVKRALSRCRMALVVSLVGVCALNLWVSMTTCLLSVNSRLLLLA